MISIDSQGTARDEASAASEIFNGFGGQLVELSGSPATATLLRRSARGSVIFPELVEIAITLKDLNTPCRFLPAWKYANYRSTRRSSTLVIDLAPCLLDLTDGCLAPV